MAGTLQGKTALVTGGSRGIGAAIARRLATEGADVNITFAGNHGAADNVIAEITSHGITAKAFQANASDPAAMRAAVDATVSTLGQIDIIVHSAGVSEFIRLDEADEDAYLDAQRRHFAINVDGVVVLTKAALPHMRDNGRVIIIGSVNAHQMPFPGTGIYGASKAAVAALARGWARDLGGRGILVNVVQPGPIDTDMNPDDDRPEVAVMTAMTAVKRYGRVEEIAAVVAFLAGDEASYVTGATIDVDGGFSI